MKSNKNIVYILLILFLVVSYKTNFCMFQEKQRSKIDIQNEDSKLNTLLTNSWLINGVPICINDSDQDSSQICSDDSGGAIIVWEDYRSETNWDIYAQKINSSGIIQWMEDGIAICTYSGSQRYPEICSDGAGGAFIAWEDSRGANSDIYAQRINSNGEIQWTENGVAIFFSPSYDYNLRVCSDDIGGIIILCEGETGILAQKVNSSGIAQWTENGVEVCVNGAFVLGPPQICKDGNGGAFIVWQDRRNEPMESDIYMQRITFNGAINWTADDVAICIAEDVQINPLICNSGEGYAIITWQDLRGTLNDIYAQRINSDGITQWITDGVPICTASSNQYEPQLVNDGAGGAIIVWEDYRSETDWDIYAQKISSSGVHQWKINGVAICTANDDQKNPKICSDGNGGAIFTWQDYRSKSTYYDIYVQKTNKYGSHLWDTDGTKICTANKDQKNPKICTDGNGGALITWIDERISWESGDIYAQRILSNGEIPIPPTYVPEPYNFYAADNDDDNDDNEKGEQEAINGYDLLILALLSFGVSIIIFFKIKKNFKNKLRKF